MSIKKFLSLLNKKSKRNHSNKKTDNDVKPKDVNGQDFIYWYTYIKKNRLKIIIPFLLIFSIILFISIVPNKEQIYSKNFKYEYYGMNRGNTEQEQFDKTMLSVENRNYKQAFKLLKEGISKDSTKYVYIYYYSLTAMKLNKHDIAQKYLIKLINNKRNVFFDDAQWCLALSYLKTDKQKAIIEFRKIANDKYHYKQKDAKKILKQLFQF